jgi:hypothetical protein
MSVDLLQEKIDSLSNSINLIDDTVKFNIGTMWAVVGVVLAAGAIILPILASTWAKSAAEKKIEQIRKDLKEQLLGEIGKKTPYISTINVSIPGAIHGKNVYCLSYKHLKENIIPSIFIQLTDSKYKVEYRIIRSEKKILLINNESFFLGADVLISNGEYVDVSIHTKDDIADLLDIF